MKNTIVSAVVAVLCTAAICVTIFACNNANQKAAEADKMPAYITEQEAADYIGVPDDIFLIMKDKLRYLDGAYMTYMYKDENGKEVEKTLYQVEALDDVMAQLMKDKNGIINFKYVQ